MQRKPGGAGPEPGPPAVCLLHLNFEPCPFCVPAEPAQTVEHVRGLADEVEHVRELLGEVEAAVIDTMPRKRRLRK